MGFYIPQDLKRLDNWLVWDSKKIPYSPKTRKRALKKGFTGYDEALFCAQHSDLFKGIGFYLDRQNNISCIDLDGCIDDEGNYSDLAESVLDMFAGTYAEISQSERGVHIFCYGTVEKALKNSTIGIEIYSDMRYIAMTGNALNFCELKNMQPQLDELINRYSLEADNSETESNEEAVEKACVKPQNTDLSAFKDDIRVIMGKIEKTALWRDFSLLHAGRWEEVSNASGLPFPSQSEADFYYFRIVKSFTGNTDLIKAIYLESRLADNLFRKNNDADYLDRSIRKAIPIMKGQSYGDYSGATDRREQYTRF